MTLDRASRESYSETSGLSVNNADHRRAVKQDVFQVLGVPAKIRVACPPALPQTAPPMANTYFDPGEQRAAKVHELFSRIAPRYDLINDLQSFCLHRSWKSRGVHLARPPPRQSALDLCCGTGDLALALARRGARVAGLDFSEQMLATAARRQSEPRNQSPEAGLHATRNTQQIPLPPCFIRGDAQRLPFPDNVFDIVTVGYGLRNLANWETGLREMWRGG